MALLPELLWRLVQAALFQRLGSGRALRLPPVAAERIGAERQAALIRRCNRLTRLLARNSRHACWYRSRPLAALLRTRGVPVELNIGLAGLGRGRTTRGHCWLSLEGRVINEDNPASAAAYPAFLGDNGSGVRFWAAAGMGEGRDWTGRKAPGPD